MSVHGGAVRVNDLQLTCVWGTSCDTIHDYYLCRMVQQFLEDPIIFSACSFVVNTLVHYSGHYLSTYRTSGPPGVPSILPLPLSVSTLITFRHRPRYLLSSKFSVSIPTILNYWLTYPPHFSLGVQVDSTDPSIYLNGGWFFYIFVERPVTTSFYSSQTPYNSNSLYHVGLRSSRDFITRYNPSS